jgi:phenylpropionate dioxygenase-like ring-hydroxylating dioxygenase large terminal subunit
MPSETTARDSEARQARGGENGSRVLTGMRRPVGGLARGLPNHWFPILGSSELGTTPKKLKRFGEDLVLWRDAKGKVHLFQDRCPHRGSSLSLGKIRGEQLSCAYHGWTFDTSGACVDIPTGEGLGERLAGLKQRAHLKSYPVEDRAGYLWAFYGDAEHITPLTVVPYELEDERWCVYRQEYSWNTSWLNILDNILDPLHALFVHVGVATQLQRAQLSEFEVTSDFAEGFNLAKRGMLGGKLAAETPVEFLLPSNFRLDLANGTQRGLFRVIMIPTPIDENNTWLVYLQMRRVSGFERLKWRFLWWTKLRKAQDLIKAQDHAILESLGPIEESRAAENLGYSDAGVIHLRRRLNQAYDQQTNVQRKVRGRALYAAWESEP